MQVKKTFSFDDKRLVNSKGSDLVRHKKGKICNADDDNERSGRAAWLRSSVACFFVLCYLQSSRRKHLCKEDTVLAFPWELKRKIPSAKISQEEEEEHLG